jgi:hypothetical protein
MRHLVAALLLSSFVAAPAFAEKDPCKGVQIKKDSFGSSRYYEAGELTLRGSNGTWTLNLGINKGGGYGAFTTMNLEQLPAGAQVEVMFEDGAVLAMSSSAAAGGQFVSIMGISTTHYEVPVLVTVEQLKELIGKPIKAFRVVVNGETWGSKDVSKGDSDKFRETVACMIGG